MKLLYCSDPFDKRSPDGLFAEEYNAVVALGVPTALLDAEEFDHGRILCRPRLGEGDDVLYRGWMMNPDRYSAFESGVSAMNARMLTSTADFRHCHHLPEWYSSCEEFTPRTVVFPQNAEFEQEIGALGWSAYFVKDYVKSLTTSRGSIARTPAEVAEVVSLIEKYRGEIEGGVCIREYEPLIPETEERFFAFGRSVHSRDAVAMPTEVQTIAARVNRPFYSIDVVRREDGALRLIEIGDGQVSDRKKWSAEEFARAIAAEHR